jgi:hypothetical protein
MLPWRINCDKTRNELAIERRIFSAAKLLSSLSAHQSSSSSSSLSCPRPRHFRSAAHLHGGRRATRINRLGWVMDGRMGIFWKIGTSQRGPPRRQTAQGNVARCGCESARARARARSLRPLGSNNRFTYSGERGGTVVSRIAAGNQQSWQRTNYRK